MIRAAPITGLALVLAGCATTSHPVAGDPKLAIWPTSDGSPADARTRFVDGATAMLGQPYRWGGSAPGGFDCSGLVVYAAAGAGIHLPRTAAEQLRMGKSVPRREVRAGDLVFMHLKHKELHVGIAIDAERFVNAPAAGGHVRIDSLDSPLYARGFMQARRVMDDRGHTIAP